MLGPLAIVATILAVAVACGSNAVDGIPDVSGSGDSHCQLIDGVPYCRHADTGAAVTLGYGPKLTFSYIRTGRGFVCGRKNTLVQRFLGGDGDRCYRITPDGLRSMEVLAGEMSWVDATGSIMYGRSILGDWLCRDVDSGHAFIPEYPLDTPQAIEEHCSVVAEDD